MGVPLGEILVELGYARDEDIEQALIRQREIDNELRLQQSRSLPSILLSVNMARARWEDRRLGKILVEMGVVTPDQIEKALQKQKEIRGKHIGLISNEEVVAVMEIPSIINSALNVYDLLSNVMNCCRTVVGSTASALFICDEETEKLAVSFYTDSEVSPQMDVSRADSIAGWVIENNKPMLMDDVRSAPRFSSEIERFSREEIRCAACVPVTIKQQIVGAIEVINKKQGDSFSEKDLALLSVIANQVGITLENIRLLGELDKSLYDLKKAQSQIIQTEKLRAIGEMASGVAHNFNNLLMGIQGNVSLALMDMNPTHPHYKRLKTIENQVQSGAKLTAHLLGYARKGKYDVKPINLNQLLKETSDAFSMTKRNVTIYRELAGDLFAIEADPGQIEQMLLTLCVNSADAMPGGGVLTFKTANVTDKDMKDRLYRAKPGNYVQLTVTDTGKGMDKETMERIFDPFFTTKEMGRGTGLGLASAYGVVKGHGGYIDVDSEKGIGSTFRIYLPASGKRVEKAVKTTMEVRKGTGTVLLVDDEDVILEVGKDLLEAMGYRVLLAGDGKVAVEVYGKNRDVIDIVILDMVMPNMGGGEAYDRIREINPNVKALLSSGYSIDGEATEILQRGCNGFIQKPFRINELAEKIREILDKK
jgi:two-component system cell cycle sensor histidine kinase/response regulator CckA